MPSERGGEHDGRRAAETVLDVVGDLAQTPHVRGDDLAGHDPGAVDLLGTFHELANLLEPPLEGLLPGRLAGFLHFPAQASHGVRKVVDLDLQLPRDLFGFLGSIGQVGERFTARYDLDAVQVGAVLAVGEDLEGPDLRAAAHVRAAAELAGETVDLNHPDEIEYFSPKSIIAPRLRASSRVVVKYLIGWFSVIFCSEISCTRRISSSVTFPL